jgi:hypothetical protein
MAIKGLDEYKTDKEFEREGVWFDFGDFKILAGRTGGANQLYTQAMTKALKPYMRMVKPDGTGIPAQVQRKIAVEVISETVVKEWTLVDVDDETGTETPIPCTYEKCVEIFTEHPDLFNRLQQFVDDKDNYLQSLRNGMAKN